METIGKRETGRLGPVAVGIRIGAAVLDRAWALVFGPPDLGAVDFATLRRRRTPNDALVCPEGFCASARADMVAPEFPVPAERLRAVLAEVALAEPGAERLPAEEGRDRFLVRTRFFRFPDTVDAQVLPRGEGRATLALYSRSQIGGSDFGVNRARLTRWLKQVEARAADERSSA
jgi:uncharacterized protein (DUF1499 family)